MALAHYMLDTYDYKFTLRIRNTYCYNIFLLETELQFNIIPSKVIPLGSHTLPETLVPLPVALLQVITWKCPQLARHDLSDVVHRSRRTTFEVEFEFRGKGVTRT